jgi:hypothetical protein
MKKLLLFALPVLLLTACKKDKDEEPANEEELITTVRLDFTELGTSNVRSFVFRDIDGAGGAAPTTFQNIGLQPAKIYSVAATFTNEAANPAEDITAEVVAEANDHQVYYIVSGANASFSNFNADANGLPLGTTGRCVTAGASTGTLTFTLKHKPGVKAANDPVTKGETDIEIAWPITVS